MVLVLCLFMSNVALYFIKISQRVSGTAFFIFRFSKGHNSVKTVGIVMVLFYIV